MVRTVLLAAAAFILGQDDAYAYIDPNVGGWLYQLLFPLLIALAGAWVALRHKIGEIFSNLAKRLRGR